MKNKYVFVSVMLILIMVVSLGLTTVYMKYEDEHQKTKDDFLIVTSFYPMYIIAENLIADAPGITLRNLSEPQTGCLHDFQLTPEDMRLLSEADVFIINGGGIESFISDVAKDYPDLLILNASEQLQLLESESEHDHEHEEEDDHEHEEAEKNAHAWMSVEAYRIQVQTIVEGLINCDPMRTQIYQSNQMIYDKKLQGLQNQVEQLKEKLKGQSVILFHEAYAYIAKDLGMETKYLLNLDEETAVSAGDVAKVIDQVRENRVAFILAEELYGSELGQLVLQECDTKVLYLDTLNRGNYDADSYINGMQANLNLLFEWEQEGR